MIKQLIEKSDNDKTEYLIKKFSYEKDMLKLCALLVNEMYSKQYCEDIKYTVNAQEESHGTLFTQPRVFFKFKGLDFWIRKDKFWVDEYFICDNGKFLEISEEEHLNCINQFRMTVPQNSEQYQYMLTISEKLNDYDWEHVRNIDSLRKGPLWSSYKTEDQKEKNEDTYVGDLSEKNFIGLLSYFSHNHVSINDIKNYLSVYYSGKLENELAVKNTTHIKKKI